MLSASRACDFVVTTEKDLVKLEKFPFATDKLVALRIDMEVSDVEQLLASIESQLKGRGKQKNGE
jgi:tetraacyldisaccharide-1-P 4'-kinase